MIGYVLPFVALLGAEPAQDGSWLAWHGCWRMTGETAAPGEMTCMLPGADAAEVKMVVLSEGAVVHESVVRADGTARPVDEGGCTGTETARWSRDGRRVFISADLTCEGLPRRTSGVLAMVAENEWVDVQSYSAAGQDASRTMRYRAVRSSEVPAQFASVLADGRNVAREMARTFASAPLELDEVIEATSALSPVAVQALLGARRHGFALNADKLIRLADAGVPASTIDVMVALSYPSTFTVQESRPRAVAGDYGFGGAVGYDTRPDHEVCMDPFVPRSERETACRAESMRWGYGRYSSFRYGYGYNDPFYYSRYGYNNYGYSGFGPGWNYGRTPVVIVRPDVERRQSGELRKGSGYTTSSGSSGRSAQPRTGSDSGGSSSTGASSTGSSSSGSTGASTGSSSSGRTAVQRGGGGGGN